MTFIFDYLPPEETFLDPEREGIDAPELARAVVIPFGIEQSVSYGGGTRHGPQAILKASHQLELFDDELWREAYRDYGIAAIRQPHIAENVSEALDGLAAVVERVRAAGRFAMVLGGEHSLTAGAIRPFAAALDDLVVLQIDAHADLRDGYLGEHFSHASAMRRVLDHPNVSVVSIGIRAISEGEVAFYEANRDRVSIYFAKDQAQWRINDIVEPLAGRNVYVTFDIDGLDSAVMPATGTPTPGGVNYWTALEIIRRTADVATIVGADVVELAPIDGLHACDYTAAAIAYKIMNYALSGTGPR
ncbi:MAG TPA: agmatinase [Hyphomicrobiaceae bacterium]|nr:agmatinase [Hyphomicrobiaceae bacterium]